MEQRQRGRGREKAGKESRLAGKKLRVRESDERSGRG